MDRATDLFHSFDQLNAIGASLSNERNIDRLLENILLAAKAITLADGGTLYRVSEDHQTLRFEIVDYDKTLSGAEANKIMDQIIEPIVSKFDAKII